MKSSQKIENYFDYFPNNGFVFENSIKELSLLQPIVKYCIEDKHITKIIDIASGSGLFSEAIEKNFPKADYYLIDLSKKALFRSKYINKIQGDAHFTPLKSNFADLVICRQGLHYMNIGKALNEFRRLLKYNGYLLISSEWWIDGDESEKERSWIQKVFFSRDKPIGSLIDKAKLLSLLQNFSFEITFHSLNFEKKKIPVEKWLRFYDKGEVHYSEARRLLLESAPSHSLDKGYPYLVKDNVEYVSKWMTVVCRLNER